MEMMQIAAILIAPLTPVLAVILVSVVASMSWPFNESDYKIIIFAVSEVSCICLFVVGFPVLCILKKHKKLTLLYISMAGGISGVVLFDLVLSIAAFLLESRAEYGLLAFIWGFLSGLCVAMSYGFTSGIIRRSNKDALTRAA